MKVTFTATDFVYAVVVGAAFQRIATPDLRIGNLLLLAAFAIVIDDWVLYHVQAPNLADARRAPLLQLPLDVIILLIWYWAALAAALGAPGFSQFAATVALFYCVSGTWEALFVKGRARLWADLACAGCAAAIAVLLSLDALDAGSSLSVVALVLPLLALRVVMWRQVRDALVSGLTSE